MLTLPEHLFLLGSCYSILIFMCMFCRSLFVLLYLFFWPLCCLFFFDILILITPLVSSNSSSSWKLVQNNYLTRDRFLSSQFEGILIYLRFIALGVRLGIRSLCIINMFSSKCFNICKVLVNDDYLGNKRNTVDISTISMQHISQQIYLFIHVHEF